MRGRSAAICVSSLLCVACARDSRHAAIAPAAAPSAGMVSAAPSGGQVGTGDTADAAQSGENTLDVAQVSASEDAAQSGGGIGASSPRSAEANTQAGSAGHSAASDNAAAGQSGTPAPVDNTPRVTVIATTELASPSDLDFNPYVADELWVVNHADSSATIIQHASATGRSVQRRLDPEGASHFMPLPMGIAFGGRETTIVDAQGKPVEGTFATCPETPVTFMGPTLWTSDLRIFGITKQQREPPFNGPDTGREGPGSHIDMLHRTPACIGIDWEGAGNIYWSYSATLQMFVRYDFAKDHGIGNADHSDGSVWRYPVKGISFVAHTPSQLAYDRENKRLYMADTGNARVVSFDPASATMSKPMSSSDNVDELQTAFDLSGGSLSDLIPSAYGLRSPSGLTLHEGRLYVSDTATSTIHKFDRAGSPLGSMVIPGIKPGGLAGMSFGPDGKLYFVDLADSRVLRLDNAF